MFQAGHQRERAVQGFGDVEKGDFFGEFGESQAAFRPAFALDEAGAAEGDGDAADEFFGDALRGGDLLDGTRGAAAADGEIDEDAQGVADLGGDFHTVFLSETILPPAPEKSNRKSRDFVVDRCAALA